MLTEGSVPKGARFASKRHLADMSLPPEERKDNNRKKKTKNKKKKPGETKGVIAQMNHATGKPEISDKRRKFEKQNKRSRKKRFLWRVITGTVKASQYPVRIAVVLQMTQLRIPRRKTIKVSGTVVYATPGLP